MAPADFDAWIGGRETAADLLSADRCLALQRALDRPDDGPAAGDNLPPLRHWLYFWTPAPRARLGRDGHPALGGFLPDIGAHWGRPTRRMWAGSRIELHRPLALGTAVTRVSTVEAIAEKAGRSGRLAFVTLRHEIADADGLAITDRHDIVYREELPGAALPPPEAAAADHAWEEAFSADPVLLFRYSALTFNGHRIHYDRDYASGVEGYGGLVVHGPLLATLLADFACARWPARRLTAFAFRGRRPVLDGQPFRLRGRTAGPDTLALWIADAEEALAMTAEARFST